MPGIYFKDGIYVLTDNDTENDICVYHYNKYFVSLYGGRIEIKRNYSETAYLTIDGISITNIINKKICEDIPLSIITSYLNAIETNGVDTFLENYKKSIEFLYGELKDLNQRTESQLSIEKEDSKIKSLLAELTKIRELLFSVLAILFSLYTYMSAGLENEKVISVYQSVMDSLA
jgi:hypothetical protein